MRALKAKNVCVVGVSNRPEKFGYKIFTGLLEDGWRVTGVNPAGGEVAGKKIFRSLQEVAERPDIVITVVSPQVTERIIDEAHRLGIGEIWMQPGSESAPAIEKAKAYGMVVTANACFMVRYGVW